MGAQLSVIATLRYQTTTCITCGVEICLPDDFYKRRLQDKKVYYCPNGHQQHFIDETEEERLKKALEAQKRRTEIALNDAKFEMQRRMRAEKSEKRAKNKLKRVHNGVCPQCSRSFTNLARHMQTKHGAETSAAAVKAECVAESDTKQHT